MEQIWVVYKLTGNCGRAYVGVTKRGARIRWRQHQKDAANGADTYLYRAMRKYGADWFSMQVLCECYSAREAKSAERAMITVHNTYAPNGKGFNLTYGGDGNWGWFPTDETRARIGAKSSERISTNPDYVKKMVDGQSDKSRLRPGNSERAANMGRAKKGIKHSPEQVAKFIASRAGYKWSEETLAKMRAIRPKGIWKAPSEWVEKMKHTKRMESLHKAALKMRGEPARAALRAAFGGA